MYRSKKDFEKNRHVKSIVDPRKTIGFLSDPHAPIYLPGYHAINEKEEEVVGPILPVISTDIIRINHYFTKSKEEFLQKRSRGRATKSGQRNMQDFIDHDRNDVFDDSMRKYNNNNNLY